MKNRKLFLLLITCCITLVSHAQFIKEYSKVVGQNVRFAAVVPVSGLTSSNLYVAGNYGSYIFIGEFNQMGTVAWAKKLNTMDTSLTINQMIKDSDGNLVLAGTSITGSTGKAFVLKFNTTTKSLVWYQKASQNTFFWDIAEMGAGGNYVAGGQETGNGTGNQSDDITMTVNRSTGALTLISNLNKNINESVEALIYDTDSAAIYTTGRYELLSGTDKFRICLTKMNTAGTVNWTRAYVKSTAVAGRFYSEDLIKDGSSFVMVGAGDEAGVSSIKNLWMIITDLNGNNLFTNKYDITTATYDGLFAEVKRYADGYIIYGSLYNGSAFTDIFLFNVDVTGNIIWAKSYPFRTRLPTTGLWNSGSMALVGNYIFQVGEKKQADGSLKGVFMRTTIATGDVGTCDADISCTKSMLIAPYDGAQTLSPVTCSLTFTNTAAAPSKQTLTSLTTCSPNGLALDNENNYEENVNMEMRTQEGENEIVYPNPTNGWVYLDMSEFAGDSFNVSMINETGQILTTVISSDDQVALDMSAQPNGIYFILITSNDGYVNSQVKVVKN